MMVGPRALVALCSLFFCVVQGAIVNRTIDDWFGDSESGTRPVFLPTGSTWKDERCTDCAINPDTNRAFRSTYNAATAGKGNDPITMTMDFEGTAIYVFFILANNQGDGITTETQARFSIDGGSSTTFSHEPDRSTRDILFNQLVFSRTGLSNGQHTLRMEAGGLSDRDIYVNFDYAIYSFDDAASDPPPSSSNPPPSSSRDPTPSSSSSSSSSEQSSSSRFTSSGSTGGSTPGPSLSFSGILPSSSSSVSGIGGDSTSGDSRGGDNQSSGSSVGGIVGGVVGGLAALGIVAFLVLCFIRRRKRERGRLNGPLNLEDPGFPPSQPPPMQSRNQATYSQAYNAVGYGNASENPFMAAPAQGQGEFQQAYNANGYGVAAPVAAAYAGSQAYSGSQGYAGSQSTQYNPYNAPAAGQAMPPASNTEGSVYSSPYGGMANMGSQSSRSQDPSSDFSHRRLVALNPDQGSPLVVTGLTQQEQVRRARQEELDRQMATVQSEMHDLDRDLKRGTSVRRRTIPRNAEIEERDMTIDEMQQQMEMMRQQIEILRENQRSDWAAGLTNDPPPGYTPDPVQWSAARPPVPPLPT